MNDLVAEPVLRLPDFNKKFTLYTDASNSAIGAILGQTSESGDEYVVTFASRKLQGVEINYSITHKEGLAVVWGIRHFHQYLYGSQFEVVTDHRALAWWDSSVELSGRLARWAMELSEYTFKVRWKQGKEHRNADCLSRQIGALCIKGPAYRRDPWLDKNLVEYLKSGRMRVNWNSKEKKRILELASVFEWSEGNLFMKCDRDKKMVPEPAARAEIIGLCHNAGHFDVKSIMSRIRERYIWNKMERDIFEFEQNCESCRLNKKGPKGVSPVNNLPVVDIFDRVSIDLSFGFPETATGNKGILVIIDSLTKFPWATPIKSKTAEEIAEKLWEYISIFGPPKELLSDQGKEFVNWIVESLSKTAGIEKKMTSAYHPQTNGQVNE